MNQDTLSPLTAISPIDGRYRSKVEALSDSFSEYALIKWRLHVEIIYFISLYEAGFFEISELALPSIEGISDRFSLSDARQVKEIETTTNHDMKAVEYFLKKKLADVGCAHLSEWVHFGLTSQDINSTASIYLWKQAMEKQYLPMLNEILQKLNTLYFRWAEIPMLARTHGQPATPTRLGKEIKVFYDRIAGQLAHLKKIPFTAKFGGATGNFNAHYVAFPELDWGNFASRMLLEKYGLERIENTTQIEPYDNLAAQCDAMKRINTILIDLCRDIWHYISIDYFKQTVTPGEVGSSAMPHKVNPIDFENAEGNLGIADALLEHFSAKLPISRLQRDLTDSTVTRNLGVPMAHIMLALQNIDKGLDKLEINIDKLHQDLNDNWAVVAEAIQTILRREQYPHPYETLKSLTRGKKSITEQDMHTFIDTLDVADNLKAELKAITPFNYLGVMSNNNWSL